ncbi:MAG: 50S ribosomal protein L22 [Candidatus Nanoarchaeia archaeon]
MEEAIAHGKTLPISPKMSMELCRALRGKSITAAKRLLEGVLTMKKPLKIIRFKKDLGHKKASGPARYPLNASKYMLELVNSLAANAENKGLNVEKLTITTAFANFGPRQWHPGRQRRTRMKSANVFLAAQEMEIKTKTETKPKVKAQ